MQGTETSVLLKTKQNTGVTPVQAGITVGSESTKEKKSQTTRLTGLILIKILLEFQTVSFLSQHVCLLRMSLEFVM